VKQNCAKTWRVGCEGLTCYHCDSYEQEDCGPLFKASSDISTIDCDSDMALCALQRQPAIPEGQWSTWCGIVISTVCQSFCLCVYM